MSAIIPAILPASREDLAEKLLRLQGVAREVQIDVIDGKFVNAPASWPYTEGADVPLTAEDTETLPYLGTLRFEVDLMVNEPQAVIGRWIRAGANRVTVHAESVRDLAGLTAFMRTTYGHDKDFAPDLLSFGLALDISTDTALIEPYLAECDFVQFMGIARIGRQGEPFDTRALPKIAAFHRAHPDMPVQVDGGVSFRTAPDLLRAGASRLVVGSGLWRAENLKEEYQRLVEAAQTYGVYA